MSKIDIRQSPSYAKFMKKCGWKILSYNNSLARQKLYIYLWEIKPVNAVIIRLHRVNHPIPFDLVEKIIKRYSYAHIRVEPNISINKEIKETEKLLSHYGYITSDWSHFPSRTSIVDLRNSENILMENMKPKTRYNIRSAIRNGVTVKFFKCSESKVNSEILNDFYEILVNTEKNKGLPSYPLKWLFNLLKNFGKHSTLALGYIKKQSVAGTLFLNDAKSIYYTLNGSKKSGKKYHVPTYIIWQAIRHAKNLGIHTLDFDGIFDERLRESTSTWIGFTRFKISFGGKSKAFMLPYEKVHKNNTKLFHNTLIKILTPEFLPSLYPEPWVIKSKIEKALSRLIFTRKSL